MGPHKMIYTRELPPQELALDFDAHGYLTMRVCADARRARAQLGEVREGEGVHHGVPQDAPDEDADLSTECAAERGNIAILLVNLNELGKKTFLEHIGVHLHTQVLEQGYLCIEPAVRVRTSEYKAWITIKGKADKTQRARTEVEVEIPRAEGLELLAMCEWRLSKVRYTLKLGSDVWEVDAFTGRHKGLYLAEIELASIDQPFERPPWLGEEVTTDKRYSNASLAQAQGRFWDNT